MQITTKTGAVVTFTDPDAPTHPYTVGKCKAMAYNVELPELEDHINALGTLVYEDVTAGREIDDTVGACLEILEDALQDRTHDWDSAHTVTLDDILGKA